MPYFAFLRVPCCFCPNMEELIIMLSEIVIDGFSDLVLIKLGSAVFTSSVVIGSYMDEMANTNVVIFCRHFFSPLLLILKNSQVRRLYAVSLLIALGIFDIKWPQPIFRGNVGCGVCLTPPQNVALNLFHDLLTH